MIQQEKSPPELSRQLGLFDSIIMMIGIVIGSGIFITTGIMAQSIPSAGLVLFAWAVGGLLTLAGALTFAELGAAMPKAGGQYVYLREAYGPLPGFLFGWILFLVSMGGSIAALGVGFAEYFGYFFPALSTDNFIYSSRIDVFRFSFQYTLSSGQIVAMTVILLLSFFNYVGVGFGKMIQNSFTVIKIGTILLFIFLGIFIGAKTPVQFDFTPVGTSFSVLLMGFGIGLIAVSWAFDGWHNVTYIAGELKNPSRNLPIALVLGTITITVLYLLVNIVYFLALPFDETVGVIRIAEKSSNALFGSSAASFVSAAVIISTFGALNGAIFVGPRVYYAMARDNLFFRKVGEVHHKFKTPGFAIILQAIWASLLALTGSYEQLFTYVVFISLLFWLAATTSVFVLRKKYPDLERPYKVWGYPVVPLVFIFAMVALIFNTLISRPVESVAGLFITAFGIPVYLFWKKKKTLNDTED